MSTKTGFIKLVCLLRRALETGLRLYPGFPIWVDGSGCVWGQSGWTSGNLLGPQLRIEILVARSAVVTQISSFLHDAGPKSDEIMGPRRHYSHGVRRCILALKGIDHPGAGTGILNWSMA